jgi:hypothetical protein
LGPRVQRSFSFEVHGYEASFILENSLEIPSRVHATIFQSCVLHSHDTTETAGVKRHGSLHDNESLRSDGSNLAALPYVQMHEFEGLLFSDPRAFAAALRGFCFSVQRQSVGRCGELRTTKLPVGKPEKLLEWRSRAPPSNDESC